MEKNVLIKQKKTREEWHEELKSRLKHTIRQMVESGCELPSDLDLYFSIREYVDRSDHTITIVPCLTKEKAAKICNLNNESGEEEEEGKYGHQFKYSTIKCTSYGAKYNIEWRY